MSLPARITPQEALSKVDSHLKELAAAAQTLNTVSDELTKQVSQIETVLNMLNLGIQSQVIAWSASNEEGTITDYVGLKYGRSGSKWGFIIEEGKENINWPQFDDYKTWPFKDAPRELRLTVVDKIPDLLQALVKKSAEVATALTKKVGYAKEIATRISSGSPQGSKK